MDSSNVEVLKDVLDGASNLSPSTGNGFGFALSLLVAVTFLCISSVVYIIRYYTKANEKNIADLRKDKADARDRHDRNIEKGFARIETKFDEIQDGIERDHRDRAAKDAVIIERLLRLEFEFKNINK